MHRTLNGRATYSSPNGRQILAALFLCAVVLRPCNAATERPETDNVCVIQLIGKQGYGGVYSSGVGEFELVSFNCTGTSLPVPIRVHASVMAAASLQEGVKLKTDDTVRGLLHFEDIRSLTILDSVFEGLTGGALAPVVWDRSAGLFYNCRFANNKGARTGGIYSAGRSLMHVYDSVFEKNHGTGYGAVFTTNGCRTSFKETKFLENKGGAYGSDGNGFVSGAVFSFQNTLTEFEGCHWEDNVAAGAGGGAATGVKRAVLKFSKCSIKGNCGESGAIALSDLSTGHLTSSEFSNNHGSSEGAPIHLILRSSITITDSQLRENKGVSGVIIAHGGSEVELDSSDFTDNAGAMYGGAVSVVKGEWLVIKNCNFESNSGAFGGALYQDRGLGSVILGSTFTSNTAQFAGGALFQKDVNSTKLTSCGFVSNDGGAVGGGVSQLGCGMVDWLSPQYQGMVTCGHGGGYGAVSCGEVSITDCSFDENAATVRGSSIFHDRCKNVEVLDTTFPDEEMTVVQKRCEKRVFLGNTEPSVDDAVFLDQCPKKLSPGRKLMFSPN